MSEVNLNKMIYTEKLHPVQLKVFFTMITLYTFYFAANYNLGTATKYIQEKFDFSNGEFGILFTIFTLGFGLGQFVAGFLGDRYNPKLLMLIGAVGATLANFCFGLSNTMPIFRGNYYLSHCRFCHYLYQLACGFLYPSCVIGHVGSGVFLCCKKHT